MTRFVDTAVERRGGGSQVRPELAPRSRDVLPLTQAAIAIAGVALIVAQQWVRTPWGLPGHRAIVWLTVLIALRWALGRTWSATAVGGAAGVVLFAMNPAFGIQAVVYLVVGAGVDRIAGWDVVRRRPWLIVLCAPILHLVALAAPLLRTAQYPGADPAGFLAFALRGHLFWGLVAGILGLLMGSLLRRGLARTTGRGSVLTTT